MTLYVNGEKVTDEQITAEMDRLRPHYQQAFADQKPEQQESQLREWSRENVIEQVLFLQEAKKLADQVSDKDVDKEYENVVKQAGDEKKLLEQAGLEQGQADKLKEQLKEQMLRQKLMEKVSSKVNEPSEKEIQKYFDTNIERFTIPEMIRASHIVKHPQQNEDMEQAKQELEGILTQIKNGTDFAELAGEGSDCPDSGGDLGYFPRGKMVPSFEEVVFKMEPGQVSDVFQTEFGYHIAKVTDKKPSMPCRIEDVKQLIEKELKEEKTQKALEKYLDDLKEKATIEEK